MKTKWELKEEEYEEKFQKYKNTFNVIQAENEYSACIYIYIYMYIAYLALNKES